MLKKIIRLGLPLAAALGLALPFLSAVAQPPAQTDQPKAEKSKKKTEKSKRKGKGERRKAEEPKAQ